MVHTKITRFLDKLKEEKEQVDNISKSEFVNSNRQNFSTWYNNRLKSIQELIVLISETDHVNKDLIVDLLKYILELLGEGKELVNAGKTLNNDKKIVSDLNTIRSTMGDISNHILLK